MSVAGATLGAALAFAAGAAAALLLVWTFRAPPAPVPEAEAPVAVGDGVVVREGGRTVAREPAPVPPPLPGRQAATIAVEGAEVEPNDNVAAANRAELGTAIEGSVGPGDRDYFAVEIPSPGRDELVANLRVQSASVLLSLFDDAGLSLGTTTTMDELGIRNTTIVRKLDRPRYYLLVQALEGPETTYQLTVAARPR